MGVLKWKIRCVLGVVRAGDIFHVLPNIPEHVAGLFAERNSFVFSFGDNSRVSGARRISIVG